ncbi:hypothetical protein HanXRQr2_Chr02g0058271 [Helianthus annuus]|uniref:Uncharacterized protein n=1 Tax=Helianthus annuus TaxID=4232 RepID=A0A9K3JLX5_HELAN|nr:hypothetical protein HanXRQr2_Chr02g0058271 [Helianthus annuus]
MIFTSSCSGVTLASTGRARYHIRCTSNGHRLICRSSRIFFRPRSCKDHHHRKHKLPHCATRN